MTSQQTDTKQIPYHREAEEAVIGAVLINPEVFHMVSRIVASQDFYIVRHRWLWETFENLSRQGKPIDFLTVCDDLEKQIRLGELGGPAYVTALINQVPSSLNAETYAGMVRKAADRRRGLTIANEIATSAFNSEVEFDLSYWGLKLSSETVMGIGSVSAVEAAQQAIQIIENSSLTYSTGLSGLNKKIGGYFPSELTVIGGYPGTGKSAYWMQIARSNAAWSHKTMAVSLEMTAAQIWLRMACGDTGVDLNKLRSKQLPKDVVAKVVDAANGLAELYQGKIVIYQAPMTPSSILAAARMERPEIVVVDHLGLVAGKPSGTGNNVEYYTDVTRFLRQQIALPWGKGDPGRAVIALHHINRSSFKEGRRPTRHDLDFAGEKDPDGVILMYRDDIMEAKVAGLAKVEFIVDKARFGWTGTEDAMFNLPRQQFAGWQTDDRQHPQYVAPDPYTDH